MLPVHARTITSLAVILLASTAPMIQAQSARSAKVRSTPAMIPTESEADFVVGRTVYLRSTGTRIGTIVDTDDDHPFPRNFARPRMKAILIRRTDGPMSWTPVERITRIYTVKR